MNNKELKIAFIGGGNMGEAILAAILSKGLSVPASVKVSDASRERCRYLQDRHKVTALADNRQATEKSDVIILAIKPQNLPEVMTELNGHLKPEQLVLSITAGAKLDTLCKGLGHDRVVRSMPNTPAQIGRGITVWTTTAKVTAEQKEQARAILGATGQEIYFEDEKYLDMATAISGSGPAYFFYFVEGLIEAAVNIGLPADTARQLVFETMQGSGQLLLSTDTPPAELRRNVTSPGGTTAAAITEFEQGKMKEILIKAVRAAYNRARELGN